MQENGEQALYFIHKDYLGSWTHISDENGDLVEENSYDAWGRRRNVTNWSYDDIPQEHLFSRGYTGHEHLDDRFNLINMNGRVYDPLIGMMVSADNYIPEIGNPNSHNRYAYAHHNPLKYTDPSGDNPFLIAFAMISTAFNIAKLANTAIQVLEGNNDPGLAKQFGSAALGLAGLGSAKSNIAKALISETAPVWAKGLAHVAVSAGISGLMSYSGGGTFESGVVEGSISGAIGYGAIELKSDIEFADYLESIEYKSNHKWLPAVEITGSLENPQFGDLSAQIQAIKRALQPVQTAIYEGHSAFIYGALENPGVIMLTCIVPAAEITGLALNVFKIGVGQAARGTAAIGRLGEARLGIEAGGKTAIESLTKTAARRFPDKLDDLILTEVKNVKSLSFTNQLKDFYLYADATGREFILYVRPTTKLSGPLQEAINAGKITLKYIPGF